jgi:hypothetical protein
MTSDLVVWTGPIYKAQAPGATVPGAKELWLGCFGDHDPLCPAVGERLRGSYESLLNEAALDPAWRGRTFLGAFSAGGSVHKRLLENPEYRQRVTAVMLSDATYTSSWADAKNRVPPPIEGFVLYACDAATRGDKLFVATASPIPNKSWASGVDNLRAIRDEVERRTGRKFTKLEHFFGVNPAPEAAYQLGGAILAEYPLHPIGHAHNKIATQVWQKILWPWLQGGATHPPGPVRGPAPDGGTASTPTGPNTVLMAVLGVVAGLATCYGAYSMLRGGRR